MKGVCLLVLCGVVACSAQTGTPTTVSTPFGPLTGLLQEKSRVFRGVPYADKTGRFERTATLTPWTAPLDATRNRDGCPQRCTDPSVACPETTSEDCLYLTIHTPRPETITRPLPVMVFLNGGNFVSGSGQSLLYDGTYFANQTDVILVGVNYRLGALGWLVNPLAGIQGNMGMTDQIRALQFVQRAIVSFGGDPNQVTLFGQSAGGTSIGALAQSPAAQGLFQKAILQSNPFGLKVRNLQTSVRIATAFTNAANCRDSPDLRACFNALTTEEVLNAQALVDLDLDFEDFIANFYKWTSTVDGELVFDQPITAWRAGQIPDIPYLMGHTSEEGVQYGYAIFETPVSRTEYEEIARVLFPQLPLLEVYPPETCDDTDGVEDCRQVLSTAITDYIWVCPMRNLMRGMVKTLPNGPHYQYRFDHVWSFLGWGNEPGDETNRCNGYVCHGAELPFVFDACFNPEQYPPDLQCNDDEVIIGAAMGSSWGQFATTANPMTNQLPGTWPQFGAGEAEDEYMVFDTKLTGTINDLRTYYCNEMDRVGYHPEDDLNRHFSRSLQQELFRYGWAGDNRSGKPRTMENFRKWLNETRGPFY